MTLPHWPIAPDTPVSSPFGYRGAFAVPGSADWLAGLHDGVDFAADYGTPVYAAHAGTLRNLLDPGGYGQYVQIDGDGLMSQYGHVRDMWLVPDGSWVEPGTLIAGVGSEGMSTGPHLHFRLHVGGVAVDPLPELQGAAWTSGGFTPQTGEQRVVRWLLDAGRFSPAGVAGIAGNIQQESGFDPDATEAGRPFLELDRTRAGATAAGYGLCQWSFDDEIIDGALVGGRLWGASGLVEWCRVKGLDRSSIDAQLRFMCWEIDTYWPGLAVTLSTATDPVEAAKSFGSIFEGWGVEGARNDFAAAIFDRIMAGEFGPVGEPVRPLPLYVPPETYLGDELVAIFIDITGPRPEGFPQTWANLGAGFHPVKGTEANRNQPAVANMSLSWADAIPHLTQSFIDHEMNIDGSPNLAGRRQRAEAARQVLKSAGLDPAAVAATQYV